MMKSLPLSETLLKASPLWLRIKEGQSIEKVIVDFTGDGFVRGAVQSVLYTALRNRALVSEVLKRFVPKASAPNATALLELALSLLAEGREKPFVVVDQTVRAAKALRETRGAANFINAVLRRFTREGKALTDKLMENPSVRFNAPDWWIKRYREVFKERAEEVLKTQQKHPPMVLRVNARKSTPQKMLSEFTSAGIRAQRVGKEGIMLEEPLPVKEIPGFEAGSVSVQDAGSQLAAQLLAPEAGMRVLDACAAPGGKSAHLLEAADVDLTALELDPARAQKIHENFQRLNLSCKVKVADASDTGAWWEGELFDRILLDAPCTASGIVRRHPDIPWTRQPEDVANLSQTQGKILRSLWPLLKKGGRLLYSVCSVFPEEGPRNIEQFCKDYADAGLIPIGKEGEELLTLAPRETSEHDEFWPAIHDGFFYALLEKR